MNYLAEILEFNNWLDENPSPPSVIVLWYALMSINNKLKWKTSFTAPIKTLELKTGLKKDAIYRARNTLKQHGLIDFKERGGNKCSEYRIVPFAESVALNDTDRNADRTQSAAQPAAHNPRSPQPFYKQNNNKNTKHNKSMGFNNCESEEYDFDAIEKKILDMMFE